MVFGSVFPFNVRVKYLKNYKNFVNRSESTVFLKFLSSCLIEKKITNCSNNLINLTSTFRRY